ncbi:rhodanese-like domain-containing protein [Caballeronia sp. SEWSISQ10-4 2]|jgi:thiosulfate/3-mercaptopyruvate sulfurtransferase|uniref:sulfurtransferase n=1 Tax=Caballeronia sp. SEWSISQ10-4 2 TaxID=2937438 RepID=UPI002650EA97|nr:rhodanese-like domain-containing protein [Caballeronia sp. SEWSISQ10-4 2]MDN7179228.1 rhodanese-like domain-containing protein [Caballeronia sp. SEWSISQ10-4 2]
MPFANTQQLSPFVRADTLIAQPKANRLFVDVRLGDPDVELERFRDSHILGAVHAQIRDVFAAPATAQSGNLPLPDIDSLRSRLAAWGVDAETEIVLYGSTPALAARGWWVLRWAGFECVSLLDGGLRAWVAAGGAVARGDAPPPRASGGPAPTLTPGNLADINIAAVSRLESGTILLDARDEAAYQAGHIPGARNLPAVSQWTPTGMLRQKQVIASQYAEAGIVKGSTVVVYCGGGVLSALSYVTLVEAGISPRLYVGSWSEWNKHRELRLLPADRGQDEH